MGLIDPEVEQSSEKSSRNAQKYVNLILRKQINLFQILAPNHLNAKYDASIYLTPKLNTSKIEMLKVTYQLVCLLNSNPVENLYLKC